MSGYRELDLMHKKKCTACITGVTTTNVITYHGMMSYSLLGTTVTCPICEGLCWIEDTEVVILELLEDTE